VAEDVFGVATDVQLASRRVEEGGRWHATSARQHLIPSLPRSSWSISHAHPPRPSPHGARWAVAQCLAPAVSAPQNARIGAHGRGVSGGVGARTGSMDALSDGPPESCAVGELRAGGPRARARWSVNANWGLRLAWPAAAGASRRWHRCSRCRMDGWMDGGTAGGGCIGRGTEEGGSRQHAAAGLGEAPVPVSESREGSAGLTWKARSTSLFLKKYHAKSPVSHNWQGVLGRYTKQVR